MNFLHVTCLKSNQISVVYFLTIVAPLYQCAPLTCKYSIEACSVQKWLQLLMSFLAEYTICMFWHCHNQPTGRQFYGWFKVDFFMYCRQSVWYLQKRCLVIQLQWVTKSNEDRLCCFRDLWAFSSEYLIGRYVMPSTLKFHRLDPLGAALSTPVSISV